MRRFLCLSVLAVTCCFLPASAIVVPQQGTGCGGYTHHMFPPPAPLPECEPGYDVDCLARCNLAYSSAMIDAYTEWCVYMAYAYEVWLTANNLCVESYDACIAAGTDPAVCLSNCNNCLNNAAEKKDKMEKQATAKRDEAEAAATAAFWTCIESCCPHPPQP